VILSLFVIQTSSENQYAMRSQRYFVVFPIKLTLLFRYGHSTKIQFDTNRPSGLSVWAFLVTFFALEKSNSHASEAVRNTFEHKNMEIQ
jgi:hypothetical protein